jgi:hypothetical protein
MGAERRDPCDAELSGGNVLLLSDSGELIYELLVVLDVL